MRPVTHLFQELVRDVHSQRWNEDELANLSGVELHALTKLLSCPSSGVWRSKRRSQRITLFPARS